MDGRIRHGNTSYLGQTDLAICRDPGSPKLRMVSWNLNTWRFEGDCTPQSSSDKVIGSLGFYELGAFLGGEDQCLSIHFRTCLCGWLVSDCVPSKIWGLQTIVNNL